MAVPIPDVSVDPVGSPTGRLVGGVGHRPVLHAFTSWSTYYAFATVVPGS